jgi:hypothetical protein
MTTGKRKMITGTVDSAAIKTARNDSKYAEVKLIPDGLKDGVTLRAWNQNEIQFCSTLKKHDWVSFVIEEKPGEYQGEPITHRNIVGIGDAPEAAPDYIDVLDDPKPTPKPQVDLYEGRPQDRDVLIIDQCLTKVAANLVAKDYTSPHDAAQIAIYLWDSIRRRHIEEPAEEQAPEVQEIMDVL